MDNTFVDNTIMLFSLPIVAIICLSMNIFIRARGNRSVQLNLRAFGVEVNLESRSCNHDEDKEKRD